MNIQKAAEFAQHTYASAPKSASQESQNKNSTLASDNSDKLITEKNSAGYSPAYTKHSGKSESRNIHKGDHHFDGNKSVLHMKNKAMQSYVNDTLAGKNSSNVNNEYQALFGKSSIISSALSAAEKTSEKHDDYWGVDATAERIFTFAKSLAGEDADMLAKMKKAFETGFNQALGSKGGKLPDISYKTKEKVYEMFAEYEKELAGKKVETTEGEEKAAETNANNNTNNNNKHSGGKTISYYGAAKYGSSYEASNT